MLGLPYLKNSRTIASFIGLAVIVTDQITKFLALSFLSHRPTVPVLPGVFHLTLVHNSGVAFGLFQGYGLLVTLATMILLIGLFRTALRSGQGVLIPVCLGLILGGAVGNVIDRVRFGGVVDFLDFRVWPVFNVADSCITVGAALLALIFWRYR